MSNGKYIEICESNLKKEYKLKIFIKNFNNYEEGKFNEALLRIYQWSIDL